VNHRITAALLAAVVVGGSVTAAVPQHAATIGRVVAVAVVVVTGGLLLGAVGPFVARDPARTALDALPRTGAPPHDPHGLRDARRDLDRPSHAGSLPRPVWDRLVAASLLQPHAGALDKVPLPTRQLLATPPPAGFDRDPATAAAIVHRTLDDLTTLDPRTGAAHGNR
jgi:hypothetical protein